MTDANGIKIVAATTYDGKSTFSPGSFEQQQARIDSRKAPQFLSRKPRLRPNVAKQLREEKV